MASGLLRPSAWSSAQAALTEDQVTQRIMFTAGGLVLLGVVLLVATVWWWRTTRPEHPALGPLEVMGGRAWRAAGDGERRRLVDAARPADAAPLVASVARPEPLDLAELAGSRPQGFEDLLEVEAPDAAASVDAVPVVEAPADEAAVVEEPANADVAAPVDGPPIDEPPADEPPAADATAAGLEPGPGDVDESHDEVEALDPTTTPSAAAPANGLVIDKIVVVSSPEPVVVPSVPTEPRGVIDPLLQRTPDPD